MKKKSQKERVLEYMRDFGSITSWDAYKDLGVTQLGARIDQLKKEGYMFNRKTEYSENRYGEQTHYTRYSLLEVEKCS